MNLLIDWATAFALGCFALGLACAAVRLMRGPSLADRVLALDTMYINGMLIILALGIRYGTTLYFDIAFLISILGFASSVALAKFLLRGEVIEP
jgi:multicomponent K+:H+ antiporter subunit F